MKKAPLKGRLVAVLHGGSGHVEAHFFQKRMRFYTVVLAMWKPISFKKELMKRGDSQFS